MDAKIIRELACPSRDTNKSCHNELILDPAFPTLFSKKDKDEITEGLLLCSRCGAKYPILLGIGILLHPIAPFSENYLDFLTETGKGENLPTRGMIKFLVESRLGNFNPKGEALFKKFDPSPRNFSEDSPSVSSFIHYLYDDWEKPRENESSRVYEIYKILKTNPQKETLKFLDSENPQQPLGMTLEVGCNVGGLVWKLAGECRYALGVDLLLPQILVARALSKGLPSPKNNYTYYLDTFHQRVEKEISIPPRANCEFLVADGTNLPFHEGAFSATTCTHVTEMVLKPEDFFEELVRTLRNEGLLSYTTNDFLDRDAAERIFAREKCIHPLDWIRSRLTNCGLHITGEIDSVPYLKRVHGRTYTLHFSYMILGRKGGSQKQ